jgi:hypothetical protein
MINNGKNAEFFKLYLSVYEQRLGCVFFDCKIWQTEYQT